VLRKKKYIRTDKKVKAFGERLRYLRMRKGMTMQELADLCDIEYSQLSRIERGIINTSLSNIYVLAEQLEIKVKELFEE
jgi:transcriptional regulator with XRE-family HTH domain